MATIVIYLDKTAGRAEVLIRLQRATGHSLNDFRAALSNGMPILEVELFEGDYASHATTLRSVLACIDEFSLVSKIYELPEGESIKTCRFVDKCEISPMVLENILNEADAEFFRQHGD